MYTLENSEVKTPDTCVISALNLNNSRLIAQNMQNGHTPVGKLMLNTNENLKDLFAETKVVSQHDTTMNFNTNEREVVISFPAKV